MAGSGTGLVDASSLAFMCVLFLASKAIADFSMDVQGSIFCHSSANKAEPIQGATAQIICKAADGEGDTTSIVSGPTDAKGFYTARSSTSAKLGNCKAFLHSSPLAQCHSPTDTNGGKSGARLIPFSPGESRNQHYSVKPFFYSPQ